MDKRSTKINIDGMDYTILGYETEEYMHSVGIYVDKMMKEIRQKCFSLDRSMVAVLTAVNVASENFKLKSQVEDLQGKIDELQKELNKFKGQSGEREQGRQQGNPNSGKKNR